MTTTPTIGSMSGSFSGSSSAKATISATAAMAKLWFQDALAVSKNTDPSVRRHEVVFSAMFLEAWLYEWVRDVVAPGSPINVEEVVPRNGKLEDRWTELTTSLFTLKLTSTPTSGPFEPRLRPLLDLRNGLVHAETSRRYPVAKPDGKTYGDVVGLEAGWAIQVALAQAENLRAITLPQHLGRWPGWMRLG